MNSLNNQRLNLRDATHAQNSMNRRSYRGSTSKYKGVFWDAQFQKWHARITVAGKQKFLGRYLDELDAAAAYDRAAIETFGEFGRLNLRGET